MMTHEEVTSDPIIALLVRWAELRRARLVPPIEFSGGRLWKIPARLKKDRAARILDRMNGAIELSVADLRAMVEKAEQKNRKTK